MVTVLPPGVIWRIPPCGVNVLMSNKSGVLDFFFFFEFNVYFCRRSYRKNTVFIQLQHDFYM